MHLLTTPLPHPPHLIIHNTSSPIPPPHPPHSSPTPSPHLPHLLTHTTSSPHHHLLTHTTSSPTPPPHPFTPHHTTTSSPTPPSPIPPPHPPHPHPPHLLTHPLSPTPPPHPHHPHLPLTHPTSSSTPPPHPPHLLTHPTLTHPTSSPTPPLTHTTPSPTLSTTQLVQTMRERHVLHCLGTQPVPMERHVLHCLGTQPVPMEGLKGTYQPPSGNMLAVMDWRPPQPRSFSDLLRQRRSLIRSSRVIPSMRHTTLEALGSLPQPQETAQTLVIRSGDEEASRRKSYRQSISNLWKRLSRSKTQGEGGRGPGVGVARWWWVWLGLCRTPHQRLVA